MCGNKTTIETEKPVVPEAAAPVETATQAILETR